MVSYLWVRRISLLKRPARQWTFGVMGAILLVGGAGAFWVLQGEQQSDAQQEQVSPLTIKTVTALGHLEPAGELIQLSAPNSNDGNRLIELRVDEGDPIKAGQIIAVLDNRDRRQADLERAQQDVNMAQAELERVLAGAQQGEINAQRAEIERLEAQLQGDFDAQAATVARLEAEVQNARLEDERYAQLYQEGAISASERDSKRLVLETAERHLEEAQVALNRIRSTRSPELQEARATLDRISEVRPVDVQVARADLERTIAAVKQAEADLAQAYVRAPQDGVVLKIHTRPGEVISSEGIVELGQIDQMQAIAEVYESDIHRVQMGQAVQMTSSSLPDQTLHGTVAEIGLKIERQEIVNTDPTSNIDARVVDVTVTLDEASIEQVKGFTNLQVIVQIEVDS